MNAVAMQHVRGAGPGDAVHAYEVFVPGRSLGVSVYLLWNAIPVGVFWTWKGTDHMSAYMYRHWWWR
jgi:hypothetical protein